MDGRFRVDPPTPQAGWLPRPRVAARLARRFEVPVVVVTAPAGYGKTTALAQALAQPDRAGRDVWVQCEPADADAEVFGAAVMRSGGLDEPGPVDAARLAGMLARFAPELVCLVLDDIHRIPDASPTWRLLDELVTVLPRNAHLVLSGRVAPSLSLARREAAGEVERIGTRDLEFDDAEVAVRWAAEPLGPPQGLGDAARWPAVSALGASSARIGPVAFLGEELASGWPAARFGALAAVAHLSDIEDGDAAAVAGTTAAELLVDLPLVQRSAGGTFQLHDLWRQLLTDPATWREAGHDAVVRDALRRLGARRLEAVGPVDAARIFAAAEDPAGMRAAALALAEQPFTVLAAADVVEVADLAAAVLGEHLESELLQMAALAVRGGETAAAVGFEAIGDRAAAAGDRAIEALALQHAINMRSILDPDRIPPHLAARAEQLAPLEPAARIAGAMSGFHAARAAGRADDAAAVLQRLSPPTTDRELVTFCFGMTDLGRPESIDAVYSVDDPTPGEDLRLDLAVGIWLRGGVSPEMALEFGAQLVDDADDGGFPHIQVPTHATFCLIALAAGDDAAVRRFADAALRRSGSTSSLPIQAFAHVVDALCVLCERDEDAAAAKLAATLEQLPIGPWPARPYLFSLPAVYVLAPSARSVIDGCRFGPAISAAVDAGRALVAVREQGDPGPALELPWDRPDLLRVHVLPPLLAELAAAAAAAGSGRVGAVLDALPHARRHLAAVAERCPHAPTAAWASVRVAAMPERPDDVLHVDVLGPVRVRRGSTPIEDPTWTKRERVRELLAHLAVHRRARRRTVAEALWPEFDPEKALANLRVNLAHLQKVLQPGRPSEAPPWYLRADPEWLELVADGVVVDTEVFEELLAQARALDGSGRVRPALDRYGEALALARGELAESWPDARWAEVERLRLRTLVVAARCRSGELQVALGEPEAAARTASSVLVEEPMQERAARLLASAMAAQGDRAAARQVVADLVGRLGEAGLAPEPETTLFARQHGISLP